jgi:hypothetical protein
MQDPGDNRATQNIDEFDSIQKSIEKELQKTGNYERYKKEWEESNFLNQFTWSQMLDAWDGHNTAYLGFPLWHIPWSRLGLDLKKMYNENTRFSFEIKRSLSLAATILGTIGCYTLVSRVSNNILHKCSTILLGVGVSYKLATWETSQHHSISYTLTEIVQIDMKCCPNKYKNKQGEKSNEEPRSR